VSTTVDVVATKDWKYKFKSSSTIAFNSRNEWSFWTSWELWV